MWASSKPLSTPDAVSCTAELQKAILSLRSSPPTERLRGLACFAKLTPPCFALSILRCYWPSFLSDSPGSQGRPLQVMEATSVHFLTQLLPLDPSLFSSSLSLCILVSCFPEKGNHRLASSGLGCGTWSQASQPYTQLCGPGRFLTLSETSFHFITQGY